jgi:Na+/H+ antiporter NhaD/arsenite permease-like protein
LIAVFYLLDRKNFLRAPARVREAQTASETWKIRGWMNAGLLAAVQAALLLPTGWREGVLASAAWTSWKFTPRPIHEANDFTLDPIKEVGWLFAGLFLTMLPALELLRAHAANTGLSEPIHFFWATGFLSAILDNAPTYLAFLSAACGLHELDLQKNALKFALDHGPLLKAISTGAVFFGALTYIGNGPNLMVKHIAQQHKAATPSFGTYIWKYSLPVLLPILCVISILFFYR